MLHDVIKVEPQTYPRLHLEFEDGIQGTVNLIDLGVQFTGVFEPLKDPNYFKQVQVHPDLGTVCWESGADLDPVVLYCAITECSILISSSKH